MDARTAARVGGWSAIVAGVTGALGATLLLAVPPGAPIDHFNYPLSPMWFVVVQAVFSVHHLLLAFVFWAFGRAGLAGRGALSAVGVWSTVTLFASFGVWEVLALSGIGRPYPSDELAWLDVGYGTLSLLLGVALILLGIAAVRARVFSGWARWATLATGVYVFVPMLPGLAAGFVAGRVVLGVWLLLFALLGWGMLRWSADSEPRPAFAAAAGAVTGAVSVGDMSVVGTGMGTRIGFGAICGLAWAAALREYMSEISGAASTVAWGGTFVGVLLPGVIVGGALGAASVLLPEGRGRVGLRWCAAAPLAFAVIPMLLPGLLWALLTTGLGGGAVGVALGGLAGGYALGGRRRWARIATGTVAVAVVLGVAASVPGIGGAPLAITTPRGAWVTLLAASLMVVYAVACAIPVRRLNSGRSDASAPDAATRAPVASQSRVDPASAEHSSP